jgi:LDH2 family malate/lactate/ureidoglycolate dehydrogenase
VRYRPNELTDYAFDLFQGAAMPAEQARTVAKVLVEADLLGHDTHGLQLAPAYLNAITEGSLNVTGEHEVVSDRQAAVVWNGRRLSGIWLTTQALDLAARRARAYGVGAVAIRDSHHTACLAAYLEPITAGGQVAFIACSDPAVATVAPYGGLDPVFTPDPMAIGIPTTGDPILIDMSASITTNGMAARLNASGGRFRGPWAQDSDGRSTDDPSVLFGKKKGTLLPSGGLDHGHKGYGMALMIETLSQGLSGEGRSMPRNGWGASVFVQVLDPDVFAGLAAFRRETGALVDLCRAARPAPGHDAVRLPGQRALNHKRIAVRDGLVLQHGIMDRLAPWAEKLGVTPPAPLSEA